MNRRTLVLALALAAVTTGGALPALSAEWTATGAASQVQRDPDPEEKDKDKDKDKAANPSASPTPAPPAADETGCRDVINGRAWWFRPVTLPNNQGEVPVGSGLSYVEVDLAAPSCSEVTYSFVFSDATDGTEIDRQVISGSSGQSKLQMRHLLEGYAQQCVSVQVQVTSVVDGFQVLHDAAPDIAPGALLCDKGGAPGSNAGAQSFK